MIKTVIIADDSTGANASTILLNKLNFKSLSLIDYENIQILDNFDAVAISTDSRAVSGEEAYRRVSHVLNNLKDVSPMLINKRIDSTLRGNLGQELNAFMDVYKNKKVAIVPAFPNSKRVCRNGLVYVNGILLEETDVAKDPKMPIFTSNAKDLFKKQTNHLMVNIYLEDVRKDELVEIIKDKYQQNDIIIFDAETNQDINLISQALAESQFEIISVDPGPFTYYYTRSLMNKLRNIDNKFIYLIGSVVDTTFDQLTYIKDDSDFKIIYVDPLNLVNHELNQEEINAITQEVLNSRKKFICITTTDINHRVVLNLKELGEKHQCLAEDISKMINNNLARILIDIIQHHKNISGVFTSGGDTTLGFLTNTQAKGINLRKEVMALTVYGKIVGGDCDGLPIITKGGMIGEKDAYSKIKEFFEEVTLYE